MLFRSGYNRHRLAPRLWRRFGWLPGPLRACLAAGVAHWPVSSEGLARDKRQKLVIHLDGGLQQLNGRQIEQLARFQDPLHPDDSRQDNTQEVARSLLKELAIPDQLGRIPALVRALQGELGTNLSEAESLSLLAAALANPDAVQFTSFPLAPAAPITGAKGQTSRLRQRAKDAPSPLWPSPSTTP